MIARLSRLCCRVFGHRWSSPYSRAQVCTRTACRGHVDAARWLA